MTDLYMHIFVRRGLFYSVAFVALSDIRTSDVSKNYSTIGFETEVAISIYTRAQVDKVFHKLKDICIALNGFFWAIGHP